MLDIEDCRRAFAARLAQAADEKQSFERALMAACEFAYRRGLQDGALARHIYRGDCPDNLNPRQRDPECPACRAMSAGNVSDDIFGATA